MKSKVLLTMLIVFIVLAGLWITCGTIFVVREVEIVDYNADIYQLSAQDKTKITEQSELLGKNILFSVKQDKIKSCVRGINPMLKVQSVKAEFPNKIVIKISRRIPLYYYGDQFFDADMCLVDGGIASGCVDISGTEINFQKCERGLIAVGETPKDNRKIEQLKIVGGYFDDLSDWKISFTNADHGKIVIHLDRGHGTRFYISTAENEDFAKILAYTEAAYQKANRATGDYLAFYEGKKIIVNKNEVNYEGR